jgi:hypothetical protein
MSYLPPSSLYLNDPEPQPVPTPEPYPEPHRGSPPEAHLEPLRLGQGPAPATPSAPPAHMYVTAPAIPHTVERILDQPPPMLPRMPATGPMSASMMPPPHVVEHVTERAHDRPHEAPHMVEHVTERVIERPNEAPQVVERIVERYLEEAPEPVQPHVVERVIERPHQASHTVERTVERYVEEVPEPVQPKVVERVIERPHQASHTVERTVERYVEEAPEPVQPKVVERVVERPHQASHTVERTVERYVEEAPEPVQPQVVERVVERIIERQPEPPPPPQVVERIIERMVDRPPPAPVLDVTPPAPTPAPVLSSSATPIHAVKGPKDWLVASPPAFLVEEHVEPRRIHIEEPEPKPEPIPEPRLEVRHEVRHEHRPEPKHEPRPEPRHEPRHEPKPVHAARHETVTRPAPRSKRHLLHRAHGLVKRHLSRDKSLPADPRDKELLWMAATAFGSVCVGLMIWGAYSTLPRPGYGGGLRADATSRNLKVVNGEYGSGHYEPARPPRIEAPPVLTGMPMPMHLPPPPVDLPRRALEPLQVPPPTNWPPPEMKIPPVVERTLDALPRRVDPAIFVKANLGDTPMIRTWDNLAKYSMMLTALAAMPAMPNIPSVTAAQPAPVSVPAVDYSKQIEALTQAIDKLSFQVKGLKEFDEKLEAMRTDLLKQIAKIKPEPYDDSELKLQYAKILQKLAERPQGTGGGVDNSAQIEELRREFRTEVASLKELIKSRPNSQLSLSPPVNLDPAPPMKSTSTEPKKARVVFVNLYDQDLYIWVNQKPHRVAKQTTQTIEEVPPGITAIEVKTQTESYHRASPELKPNETYTLKASR